MENESGIEIKNIMNLFESLIQDDFYGRVEVVFEAGAIVLVNQKQSFKKLPSVMGVIV